MAGRCRQREQRSRNGIVARHAARVGEHPAKAELGLGIAVASRLTVKHGCLALVLGHAFAVLVRYRLRRSSVVVRTGAAGATAGVTTITTSSAETVPRNP
jgi:hypothetical protein